MNQEEIFTQYKNRTTHWGESTYRPIIPNVPTVLPPDLPPPLLHMVLLRVQQEEAQYKFDHLEAEADYAVWRANALDLTTWSGRTLDAKRSRAKEILSKEIRQAQLEFDQIFPIMLPPPPPRTQEEEKTE